MIQTTKSGQEPAVSNPGWKEIAEAASQEQDGEKLLELTRQLLEVLEGRAVRSKSRADFW